MQTIFSNKELEIAQECSDNPLKFLNYCKILTSNGFAKFKPYHWQKTFIESLFLSRNTKQPNHIVAAGRQMGKTTACAAYALWTATFFDNKVIGIISCKRAQGQEILFNIKQMQQSLPEFLKLDIKVNNKDELQLSNGSRIIVGVVNPNSVKGRALDLLICDEVAHWHKNEADDFAKSVFPTQACKPNAQMIMISTPNGKDNLFYDIFDRASHGRNSFTAIHVKWNGVPGRTTQWKMQQVAFYGTQYVQQEYEAQFLDKE